MNAMNPAWEPPAWGMRGRLRRHLHGRPPFGPMAAAMDAGPPAPPPFEGPVDDEAPGPHGPGRRGRRYGGPRFGPGFGPGFGPHRFPGPRGRRRGRRTARGDIRTAVLALVAEQPRHGYEIIQEIAERTGGAWRPSPGSVYPTLSQLEDEGLVRVEQSEGRRVVHLTDAGTTYVAEHRAELDAVWASVGQDGDDDAVELWEQLAQLHAATQQVLGAGTAEQIAAATAALAEARKTIYRLLAE
jgi:DNA-binding PadR family transcriptional regulator